MPIKLRSIGQKLKPPMRAKLKMAEKRVDPFYNSPEWRALMVVIKRHRGERCEDREHWPEHPRIGIRIYGDHIIERKDGGAPLDPRNILLRCPPCHQRKTAAERAKRYHSLG